MHVIENELTIDRGVTLSSWGGQAARVSVMSLGKGRRAGWVAQITGLDIAHTFSRVFCRASVDQRDRAGRGLLVFELPDGRYEANAPRIGRVCFHVDEGVITRSDVPEMLALVRADAGVSYGDVRAMVSARKLSSARQLTERERLELEPATAERDQRHELVRHHRPVGACNQLRQARDLLAEGGDLFPLGNGLLQ